MVTSVLVKVQTTLMETEKNHSQLSLQHEYLITILYWRILETKIPLNTRFLLKIFHNHSEMFIELWAWTDNEKVILLWCTSTFFVTEERNETHHLGDISSCYTLIHSFINSRSNYILEIVERPELKEYKNGWKWLYEYLNMSMINTWYITFRDPSVIPHIPSGH